MKVPVCAILGPLLLLPLSGTSAQVAAGTLPDTIAILVQGGCDLVPCGAFRVTLFAGGGVRITRRDSVRIVPIQLSTAVVNQLGLEYSLIGMAEIPGVVQPPKGLVCKSLAPRIDMISWMAGVSRGVYDDWSCPSTGAVARLRAFIMKVLGETRAYERGRV